MKTIDDNLNFLAKCHNDDLKVLADYLTTDKDGKQRLSADLPRSKAYKVCFPDKLNVIWDDIVNEFQMYGGNTVANIFRGYGVPYRDILEGACKVMKVDFDEDETIELIEEALLNNCMDNSIKNMNAEQLKTLAEMMNIATDGHTKEAMIAALQIAVHGGDFTSYINAVMVANAVCKSLLGKGLGISGNSILTKYMSIFEGPVGQALSVIDTVAPAYRITIPCCVQIAYMRIKSQISLVGGNNE